MENNDKTLIRCAVYTRKSTQEGLEQAFNSLDAQRESGEAYIKSQMHQNWDLLPKHYDDGGFSGGSLERPALNELIADIAKGLIDTVVVYKIDRLSRSLHDFIRLIDIFDKFGVSFVSVTQQFDTTKPMGRLTLNVLLSFAQFEREVIGERIRDKIAASKKRGMWMGGKPPLGYTVKDRKLIIVPKEADAVRYIFQEYLNCLKTKDLLKNLEEKGIRSKVWTGIDTKVRRGGSVFNKAMLLELLHNRIYIGEVVHKDKSYPGEHEGIINKDLFDRAQDKLNKRNLKAEHNQNQLGGVLHGLLFDADDQSFSLSYSVRKSRVPGQNKTHRYYASPRIAQGADNRTRVDNVRIEKLDGLIISHVRKFAPQQAFEGWDQKRLREKRSIIRQYVDKVILREGVMDLFLKVENKIKHHSIPIYFRKYGDNKSMFDPSGKDILDAYVERDISLISALVQAYKWRIAVKNNNNLKNIAKLEKLKPEYVEKIYELNFLSPKIKEAILDGTQPKTLTLRRLLKDMPVTWQEQENIYGV